MITPPNKRKRLNIAAPLLATVLVVLLMMLLGNLGTTMDYCLAPAAIMTFIAVFFIANGG